MEKASSGDPSARGRNEHISTNWREFWSSKLPCWDTDWHLSDPAKKLPPWPPCIPSGEFAWLPWSLPQGIGLLFPVVWSFMSLALTDRTMDEQVSWSREIWCRVSHSCLVWPTEEGWPHLFGPQVVLRDSGVKVQPVCWSFLFGHLTTFPCILFSLLFPSFDTFPFGVCINIIFHRRILLHVCIVPCMVRSWGNCSWQKWQNPLRKGSKFVSTLLRCFLLNLEIFSPMGMNEMRYF